MASRDNIFEWATHNDARFSLDLKNGFDFRYEVFARALALVEQYDLLERAMFIAWDHVALRRLKEQHPAATTRALIRGRPLNLREMLHACRADAVSLSYDLASADDIRMLHDAGIAVFVPDLFEPDFARVVAVGADGLSWGDPLQAVRELQALGARG